MDRNRLAAIDRNVAWTPQPGPQLDAFLSPADVTLFGGAAGGGKTALGIGLALTRHRRTLFIRREATQLQPVIDEIGSLIGTRDGFNGQDRIWRLPGGRQIQFGGVPNLGDEVKYQGNPRDLLVLDEAANLLEEQARFLMGWVRSTAKGQRCRTLLASNPPGSAEGEWLIRWFAPWLDPSFPTPAQPGELRWVAMFPGEGERWVDGPAPFTHGGERITPTSRTFIPSRIEHNVYLRDSGYLTQLQALPEPLRSQLLHGSFVSGRADDEWQVIPTAWVKAAMDRWTGPSTAPVESVGVDPSRGGDETIIAVRRAWVFDPLIAVPAHAAAHGGNVAKKAMDVAGPTAPVHVDSIGIGASVLDHLDAFIGSRAVACNGAAGSDDRDMTGHLKFANQRAAAWWRCRELLSPDRTMKVALPKDHRLLADLAAPRYRVTARGIQVEDKSDIKRRLGRSPDRGDAVVLACLRTPVLWDHRRGAPFRSLNRSALSTYFRPQE